MTKRIPTYGDKTEAEARLTRVFEAADCRTQMELADVLGIRQSSISDAKRRGVIPPEWLIKLLRTRGINPEWILTGKAPRLLQPIDHSVQCGTELKPLHGYSSQQLMTELVRRAMENLYTVP